MFRGMSAPPRPPGAPAADRTCATLDTPLGPLLLVAAGEALVAATFGGGDLDAARPPVPPAGVVPADDAAGVLAEARAQLTAWFAGTRTTFDLPLAPAGTAFQQRVWTALAAIPYGATASYAELARALGDPAATRAVGAANGRNPLAVIVPCHRVVGAGGALTGYAAGVGRKRWLLRHEAAVRGAGAAGGFALALG
jgi:methylated-DNA-[protein]-cysteine S-methyltransferase